MLVMSDFRPKVEIQYGRFMHVPCIRP